MKALAILMMIFAGSSEAAMPPAGLTIPGAEQTTRCRRVFDDWVCTTY